MQTIAIKKKVFYFIMGGMCIFMATAILTRMGMEFTELGATTYGRHLPFENPIFQALHIMAGLLLWATVLTIGITWCLRAIRGTEKPDAVTN